MPVCLGVVSLLVSGSVRPASSRPQEPVRYYMTTESSRVPGSNGPRHLSARPILSIATSDPLPILTSIRPLLKTGSASEGSAVKVGIIGPERGDRTQCIARWANAIGIVMSFAPGRLRSTSAILAGST